MEMGSLMKISTAEARSIKRRKGAVKTVCRVK
jgi:hypothetical protein